jgi:hypothetical protein
MIVPPPLFSLALEKINKAFEIILGTVNTLIQHLLQTHKAQASDRLGQYVASQHDQKGVIHGWLVKPTAISDSGAFYGETPERKISLKKASEAQQTILNISHCTLETDYLEQHVVPVWFVNLTAFAMANKISAIISDLIKASSGSIDRENAEIWNSLGLFYELQTQLATIGVDHRRVKRPDVNKFNIAWPVNDVVQDGDQIHLMSNVVGVFATIATTEKLPDYIQADCRASFQRRALACDLLQQIDPTMRPLVQPLDGIAQYRKIIFGVPPTFSDSTAKTQPV